MIEIIPKKKELKKRIFSEAIYLFTQTQRIYNELLQEIKENLPGYESTLDGNNLFVKHLGVKQVAELALLLLNAYMIFNLLDPSERKQVVELARKVYSADEDYEFQFSEIGKRFTFLFSHQVVNEDVEMQAKLQLNVARHSKIDPKLILLYSSHPLLVQKFALSLVTEARIRSSYEHQKLEDFVVLQEKTSLVKKEMKSNLEYTVFVKVRSLSEGGKEGRIRVILEIKNLFSQNIGSLEFEFYAKEKFEGSGLRFLLSKLSGECSDSGCLKRRNEESQGNDFIYF